MPPHESEQYIPTAHNAYLQREVDKLRESVHDLRTQETVTQSRVGALEEVEKNRFGKSLALVGLVVTLTTAAVNGLFWLFTRLPAAK